MYYTMQCMFLTVHGVLDEGGTVGLLASDGTSLLSWCPVSRSTSTGRSGIVVFAC